jgi:hypothetical protein
MKQALGHLLSDFLSTVLFLVTYAATGDVRITAGVAIVVGVARGAWLKVTIPVPKRERCRFLDLCVVWSW